MNEPDSRLAILAARLLDVTMQLAQAGSEPEEVARAAAIHDARKLYPRLTVTAPHGGGAIRLSLVLCDPETDEPVVRMFEGEAKAEVQTCQ